MKTPLFRLLLAIVVASPLGLSAQSPAGNWKTSVPNAEGKMMLLQVNIMDNGTYTIDFGADGTVEIKGKYTLDKETMTIQDTEGSDCMESGVYTFKVEGDNLTMTRIKDGCANRGGPEGVMQMERG